jgi:tRNA dimethylallyltransferase
MTAPRALAIVGPTAAGKTELSLLVARRLDGEIVSMDSRQVYRGMDIGTAKATPAQRASVPHHGLDLVDPDQRFGAGEFSRLARALVEEIRGRGRVPILAGGTGFFLRALTNPIFREPELDPERRQRLQAFLEERPTEELHAWLRALDPPSARRLESWGGRQRLLRALELPLLTGRPLSWWHEFAPPEDEPLPVLTALLEVPREVLDERIARRVDGMVAAGLEREVRSLLGRGFTRAAPGMNATGYAELIPAIDGGTTLEAALELVRRNTRAYSRRQRTWFRHQLPPGALRLDATRPFPELADEVASHWRRAVRD